MPDNIAPAMAKKYARALLRQQNRARAAALSADPQPYEALWSKATATTSAWFALSNVTGDTTSVDYFVTGAQGTRIAGSGVTLAPHATSTISLEPLISQLPEAERQAGGLEIDPHAPSGATLIAGALQDPASDTSLSLQFLRRGRAFGPPGLGRLAVVGLPVGAPPADFGLPQDVTFAPEVSLRNTTGAPLPVAVRLEITAGTSNPAPLCKFELPVTLAPRQERDVALGPSLATEKCAASGMINLVASFRGHRGDLEMEAHSTDSSGVYTVDAELHALDNIFKPATGLERWTNAGGQTTLITLWNPSSQAQQLRLEFTGGAGLTMRVVHSNRICDQCYFLPLALPAQGSVTLSTAELRGSAPPDQFGRSFPAAPSGSLKIVTQATPLPDATGIVDLRKSGPQQVGIAIGAFVISPTSFATPAGVPAARPAVLRPGSRPAGAERAHHAAKLVRARLQMEAIGVCQVSPELVGGGPCGWDDDADVWANDEYVAVNGTVQTGMEATEEPNEDDYEDLPNPTFNSSDTSIATVDSSGVVTGVAAGSVTIYASDFVPVWNPSECECPDGLLGANTTLAVTACGDPTDLDPYGRVQDRGELIEEYAPGTVYGSGVMDDSACLPVGDKTCDENSPVLTPTCDNFTESASGEYFSFNELNIGAGNDSDWALIQEPLLVPPTAGWGLEYWRYLWGQPMTVSSGYRRPEHNLDVGGVAESRHMFGDAADIASTEATWQDLVNLTGPTGANASYTEPVQYSTYGHVHADWRAVDDPPQFVQ